MTDPSLSGRTPADLASFVRVTRAEEAFNRAAAAREEAEREYARADVEFRRAFSELGKAGQAKYHAALDLLNG